MKLRILALLLFVSSSALATDITLVIESMIGNAPFRLGSVYPGIRSGSFYRPELLRYYISGITIHHDGSKSTPVPDVYLLVDVKNAEQRYPIANLDISSVDSLTFHIGVDRLRNHLDPTTYPDWHPLALQVPSMHWGWTSGYRFVTYEGMAGTSATKLTANFQIHTLDNALYTRVATPASSTRTATGIDILVRADYGRLLDGLDVSRGLIMHGSTDEAITLMKNIGSVVYSQSTTTSVDEQERSLPALWPNPATDIVNLTPGTISARVVDISGTTVLEAELHADAPLLSIGSLAQGTYGVVLRTIDGSMRYENLVVLR